MKAKATALAGIPFLLGTLLNGCTRGTTMPANQPPQTDSDIVQVNLESAGKPVSIHSGQSLRLTLSETPSTGYRWKLTGECGDHLMRQNDAYTEPGNGGEIRPGAAGEHTWLFRAGAPGKCELKLQSVRSWEKDVSGQQLTYPLTIVP